MIFEEVTLNLLLQYLNGMNNLADTENVGKPVAMIKQCYKKPHHHSLEGKWFQLIGDRLLA